MDETLIVVLVRDASATPHFSRKACASRRVRVPHSRLPSSSFSCFPAHLLTVRDDVYWHGLRPLREHILARRAHLPGAAPRAPCAVPPGCAHALHPAQVEYANKAVENSGCAVRLCAFGAALTGGAQDGDRAARQGRDRARGREDRALEAADPRREPPDPDGGPPHRHGARGRDPGMCARAHVPR
jgi:hypothetical protein